MRPQLVQLQQSLPAMTNDRETTIYAATSTNIEVITDVDTTTHSVQTTDSQCNH